MGRWPDFARHRDTFLQEPVGTLLEKVNNTEDVDFRIYRDGALEGGALYDDIQIQNYESAIVALTTELETDSGTIIETYRGAALERTYVVHPGALFEVVAFSLNVDASAVAAWTGLDGDGNSASNDSLLFENAFRNLTIADAGAQLALVVPNAEGGQTDLLVKAGSIGFGESAINLASDERQALFGINDGETEQLISFSSIGAVIAGRGGNDLIVGGSGNDFLFGDTTDRGSDEGDTTTF